MTSLLESRFLSLPASIRRVALQAAYAPRLSNQSYKLSRTFTTTTALPSNSSPQSSVNATEVSHFNVLASSWWDPHGSSRLLHLMNPLRHDFIRRCLKTGNSLPPESKTIYLDIGCGGGIFAESAARLSTTQSVTAIDPTPEVIAVAQRHQRTDPLLMEPGRLTYLNTAIEDLSRHPNAPQEYDIISLFEVIEHIQKPSPFLQSVLKHLKPGGWLIGSTIARTNTSWFTTKFVAEELLRMVPRGTHDWNQYIQPTEMASWARAQEELLAFDGLGSGWEVMGVVYVPGLGWKKIDGSEAWGNYFFGMRKKPAERRDTLLEADRDEPMIAS
nr:ubiquinone biosynthesis o-methyltransferase, mitochondrial [Quercus suber]